jgi:hypothetical protein
METIDLNTFDQTKALTLRDAAATGKLNNKGRKPGLSLLQRWSNPKRGRQPVGPGGPRIVLPTIITGRERLTMPEWVDWFVRQCTAVMIQANRELTVPPSQAQLEKRAEAAKARLRKQGVKC